MKKTIITTILIMLLFAGIGVGIYFIASGKLEQGNVDDNNGLNNGNNNELIEPELSKNAKDEDVSYDFAVLKLAKQFYTNGTCNTSDSDECVNYPGDKVTLSASFTMDVENANTIFSFNSELTTYDATKDAETQTALVNNKPYTASLRNANLNSVTINISQVELTETELFSVSRLMIYAYQWYSDGTVQYKRTFSVGSEIERWYIEVTEEMEEEIPTETIAVSSRISYITNDYSDLDHIGFDGKPYTHTNMSLKNDSIAVRIRYMSAYDDLTAKIMLNGKVFDATITPLTNSYNAVVNFKYSDLNSDTVTVTNITYSNGETTYTETINETIITPDKFTFYDGIYKDMTSIMTEAEKELFGQKYSNQAEVAWDGTSLGQNMLKMYGMSGDPNEYFENPTDLSTLTEEQLESVRSYTSLIDYNYAWSHKKASYGAKLTNDPYTIKGNWLVANDIVVEHLGGLNGTIESSTVIPLTHGKAQMNLFNHDVILDGLFDFDGYSIKYGDLESDYGTRSNDKPVTYTTFQYLMDLENSERFMSHVFGSSGIAADAVKFSSLKDDYFSTNTSSFSLFQKITENGTFKNCYLDFSNIPNDMGKYYSFLGIDLNYGTVENIKTDGKNLVVWNGGIVRNIEQNIDYMLNSIWAEEADTLGFHEEVKYRALYKSNQSTLVMANLETGVVENTTTNLNLVKSKIYNVSGFNDYIGYETTATDFVSSSYYDEVYQKFANTQFTNLYSFFTKRSTKWNYGTVSAISDMWNAGKVTNAKVNCTYFESSENLTELFKVINIDYAENTVEEAYRKRTETLGLEEVLNSEFYTPSRNDEFWFFPTN